MIESPASSDAARVPHPRSDRLLPVAQQQGRAIGWVVALAITALAGVLRFWHLGLPAELLSDESYYAKDAWSLWHFGYTTEYVDHADDLLAQGQTTGLFTGNPSFAVHPDVGKWLIGAGEHLFGMTPFGWRFSSAVAGTLLILLVIRLMRRLTGSLFLAAAAGLLFTFDGLEFGMSRLGMLDIFLIFFVVLAIHCLVIDRDWSRARLYEHAVAGSSSPRWGPLILWRPWRLAAGLAFGLAVGTKWSALFVIAAFGLVVLVWDAAARRHAGIHRALLKSLVIDGVPAFGYLVVVAFVVYLVSYSGWLLHWHVLEQAFTQPGYDRPFGYDRPYWGSYVQTGAHGFLPELLRSLRDLWHYHTDIYAFHTVTLASEGHPQASSAVGWPIISRPYWTTWVDDVPAGTAGCAVTGDAACERGILLAGTPALWWIGSLAMIDAIYLWIARRDWRYTVPIVGFFSVWAPWLLYGDRPTFYYYAVALSPFLVMALVLVMGRVLSSTRRLWGRVPLGTVLTSGLVALVAANFAWFWPVYTNQPLTPHQFHQRVWFSYWELWDGGSGPPVSTSGEPPSP